MLPQITCVRHAQGVHNLSFANHSILDPDLTPFGEQQCRELAVDFPHQDQVDLIVCSPLRRTIYTALHGFRPAITRGVKVIALPEIQETADVPCDTGSDIDKLRQEMQHQPVDLALVHEGWNSKKDRWAPLAPAIEQRAREARQWLKARPERNIVVVTHGGFLHYFTEDWQGYVEIRGESWPSDCVDESGTGWANVEHRTYTFREPSDDNSSLIETSESRNSRQHKPLTNTEVHQLQHVAAKTTAQQSS